MSKEDAENFAKRVMVRIDNTTDDEWSTLIDEFKTLSNDDKVIAWWAMTAIACQGNGAKPPANDVIVTQARKVHKHFAELVLQCFGVTSQLHAQLHDKPTRGFLSNPKGDK